MTGNANVWSLPSQNKTTGDTVMFTSSQQYALSLAFARSFLLLCCDATRYEGIGYQQRHPQTTNAISVSSMARGDPEDFCSAFHQAEDHSLLAQHCNAFHVAFGGSGLDLSCDIRSACD